MGRAFAAAFPNVKAPERLKEFLPVHDLGGLAKGNGANGAEGHGGDPVGQRVLQLAGIDDPQVFEAEVVDDDVHGLRGFRGIRST